MFLDKSCVTVREAEVLNLVEVSNSVREVEVPNSVRGVV